MGRLLGVHGLHPTSRLDVGVSGVVLFAEGDEARVHLARMRELGRYARHYVALCRGVPEPRAGTWSFPIGRDRDPRKRRVGGRDATHAETSFAVVATANGAALLAVEPQTGRTHQIRVHASHVGAPLLGDAAYGGPTRIVTPSGAVLPVARIALHAAWVMVPRVDSSELLRAYAPIPTDMLAFWEAAGGDPTAWDRALEPLAGSHLASVLDPTR